MKKQNKNQKKVKKEKDSETEKLLMYWFNEYKAFSENHTDLSPHFYYHYKEIELSLLPYLPASQQLKILKTMKEDYEKIESMNPDYGENLFMYGTVLYMMPKIAGGDKELGMEKIKRASEVSLTEYEKISALTVYSQLLFEEKKSEESKMILKHGMNGVCPL